MRTKNILKVAFAMSICSPTFAQTVPANQQAFCSNYQAQIEALSAQLSQTPLWDDKTIITARSSLAKLQASRVILTGLARRLNSAEQSADNAEALDRSAEANVWRRDAADVHAQIDNEKKKAKAWAADAGVSCPGCTYSVAIAKVQTAIDIAVAARTTAFQTEQRITNYKATMAAARCGE